MATVVVRPLRSRQGHETGARQPLRAIVLEQQREAAGIVAPKAVRVAVGTQLAEIINDHRGGRQRRGKQAKWAKPRVKAR